MIFAHVPLPEAISTSMVREPGAAVRNVKRIGVTEPFAARDSIAHFQTPAVTVPVPDVMLPLLSVPLVSVPLMSVQIFREYQAQS